jgi:GNAT superfamily N-acetyltransferase
VDGQHENGDGMVPTGLELHTYAERPDLADVGIASADVWPEYNLHGEVVHAWWGSMCEELPEFQSVVVDSASGQIVAELNTVPVTWDGDEANLPAGIDQVVRQAVLDRRAGIAGNTLCAMAATVAPSARGRGLARVAVQVMRAAARERGYGHLIAPVRPSWKDRYPIVAIERYVSWTRPDGWSIDPWIRVHQRLGARIATSIPDSLRITGTVAEWESWTGLLFPESGDYVFPRGLAPVHIDRDADRGLYYEPNVWLIHDVRG